MEKVRLNYPGYPIWVTEYNANINRSSQTIHRYFMKLSADWMNQTPYVERYAYFFPNSVPATNTDRSLNPVGNYWKSLAAGQKSLAGNLTGDASLF
jgi:hypothetical protein